MAFENNNPYPKAGKFERKEGTGSAWKSEDYNPNGDDADPNNYYAQGKIKVAEKEWNIRIYANKPDPAKPKKPQFNIWVNDPDQAKQPGGGVQNQVGSQPRQQTAAPQDNDLPF